MGGGGGGGAGGEAKGMRLHCDHNKHGPDIFNCYTIKYTFTNMNSSCKHTACKHSGFTRCSYTETSVPRDDRFRCAKQYNMCWMSKPQNASRKLDAHCLLFQCLPFHILRSELLFFFSQNTTSICVHLITSRETIWSTQFVLTIKNFRRWTVQCQHEWTDSTTGSYVAQQMLSHNGFRDEYFEREKKKIFQFDFFQRKQSVESVCNYLCFKERRQKE